MADREDMKRMAEAIEAPIVIVLAISADGQAETLSKGVRDEKHWFWIFQQLATEAAQQVYAQMTAAERRQMRIVLPTEEDARRMGIYRRDGLN